jgi:hypothetical protein
MFFFLNPFILILIEIKLIVFVTLILNLEIIGREQLILKIRVTRIYRISLKLSFQSWFDGFLL